MERAIGPPEASPAPRTARWRPSRRWQLVLAGCFFIGMFVNGAVLASIVTGPHKPAAQAPKPSRAVDAPRLPRTAQLEREVLLALVHSPSRLPARLVDPATGLPKNNLRVACRSAGGVRYACGVSVPGAPGRLRLRVLFQPGRGGLEILEETVRRAV